VNGLCAPCDPWAAYAAWDPVKLAFCAFVAIAGGMTLITMFIASPLFPGIFGEFGMKEKELEKEVEKEEEKEEAGPDPQALARIAEKEVRDRELAKATDLWGRLHTRWRAMLSRYSIKKMSVVFHAMFADPALIAAKYLKEITDSIRHHPRVGWLIR